MISADICLSVLPSVCRLFVYQLIQSVSLSVCPSIHPSRSVTPTSAHTPNEVVPDGLSNRAKLILFTPNVTDTFGPLTGPAFFFSSLLLLLSLMDLGEVGGEEEVLAPRERNGVIR